MTTEIRSTPPKQGAEYALFSFPRLSRVVVRNTFLDRFVTAMFMDADGKLPAESDWTLVAPENWPEEMYVPGTFDVVAVTTSDTELLRRKYDEYRAYVGAEFANYAEEPEIAEVFLPEEPVFYIPVDEDWVYSAEDRSARAALSEFYDDPEWRQHEAEIAAADGVGVGAPETEDQQESAVQAAGGEAS